MSEKTTPSGYRTTFSGINDEQRAFIKSIRKKFNRYFLTAIKEKIECYPDISKKSIEYLESINGKKKDMQTYPLRDVPQEHLDFIENSDISITDYVLMAVFEKIERDRK